MQRDRESENFQYLDIFHSYFTLAFSIFLALNEANSSQSSLSSSDVSDSQEGKASKDAATEVSRKRKATKKAIELPKKLRKRNQINKPIEISQPSDSEFNRNSNQISNTPLQPQTLQTNSEIFEKTAAAIDAVVNVIQTTEDTAHEDEKDSNVPTDRTTPGKGVTNGNVN